MRKLWWNLPPKRPFTALTSEPVRLPPAKLMPPPVTLRAYVLLSVDVFQPSRSMARRLSRGRQYTTLVWSTATAPPGTWTYASGIQPGVPAGMPGDALGVPDLT